MMMSLGLFIFALPTIVYQDLTHKMDVRFAANERVGNPDAVQFLGPGSETMTLSGVTADGINHPNASFALLRAMMAGGAPHPLVDGIGNVFGLYVIESIDRKKTLFTRAGQARRTEWTIELNRVDNPGGRVRNVLLDAALDRLGHPEKMIADKLSLASLPGVVLPGLKL